MKLSIVIPAYNEEALIGDCISAVSAELARTSSPVEVIVVNNASTDRTGEIARSFPFVRVVDESRKGLVRARQTGYEVSSGDLIANVDADTRMPQGWVEQVLHEFVKNPQLAALSGPQVFYDLSPTANWFVRGYYYLGKGIEIVHHLVTGRKGAMVQGGNFIVRRTALKKAGGFDLNFDFYGEDTAIAKQMSHQGDVLFTFRLPMPISGRRLKAEGMLIMAWRYGVNFLWTHLFNKAYTKNNRDIRV